MAIDITGADAYFAANKHTQASIWAGFQDSSPDMKNAAIEEAKNQIALISKKDPDANLPTDVDDRTEFPRYDYAVYEQAIFLLVNGIIADGSESTAKFIAGRTVPDGKREKQPDTICPRAIKWLFRGRIQFARG